MAHTLNAVESPTGLATWLFRAAVGDEDGVFGSGCARNRMLDNKLADEGGWIDPAAAESVPEYILQIWRNIKLKNND